MVAINQNVSSGKYAVAIVGYRGWRRDYAIGDGITSATSALVTRCQTSAEADELARKLNASQPRITTDGKTIPVYEAMPYVKTDYISRQARNNGNRDCDRRIVHL